MYYKDEYYMATQGTQYYLNHIVLLQCYNVKSKTTKL
jgi:hypothetical protein